MGTEIKINPREYNDAVRGITNANTRSVNNNSNFSINFENSDSGTITSYGQAIYSLKAGLQTYSERLNGDIEKLYQVRDEVEEIDKTMSTALYNRMGY